MRLQPQKERKHGPRLSRRLALAGLFFLALAPNPAHATTRMVYFSASAVNRTVNGIGAGPTSPWGTYGAQSACQITVENPSSQTESITLFITVQNIDGFSGGYTFSTIDNKYWGTNSIAAGVASAPSTNGSVTGATCNGGNSTCNATLAAGSSVTFPFLFDQFPAGTIGWQALRCSGSIEATDAASPPGYVTASGGLTVFAESSTQQQNLTGGIVNKYGGYAVFSQLPIVINRSKPF